MKGRRLAIALILAVLAIAAGAWLLLRPAAIPDAGTLAGALWRDPRTTERKHPDDRRMAYDMSDVFTAFLPPAMPVDRRRAILLANGFECDSERQHLLCRRAAPRTDPHCRHQWIYDTRAGEALHERYVGYLGRSCM